MKKKRASSVKHVILSVAIALVLVFFVAYATQTIYPAPQYEDFCGEISERTNIDNQSGCESVGGKWVDYQKDSLNMEISGWCNSDYQCREDYSDAREPYERNVFILNIVLGLVIIILSFVLSLEAVSNGLMSGGVLLLVYASIRYWSGLSDILRTLILGIALVALIFVAYKKLKD